ncbi:MAG: MmcB family DNA repair protein [Pseudomonadota bacterium]
MTHDLKPVDQTTSATDREPQPRSAAGAIVRGTRRMLLTAGWASLTEVTLPDGHRADIMAINDRGEIMIVEVKSSLADFRSDHKWHAYQDYCDRFYFAVDGQFPDDLIPEETGLIRANAYEAIILREAIPAKLAASRRKSLTHRFAAMAGRRLQIMDDPWAGNLHSGLE